MRSAASMPKTSRTRSSVDRSSCAPATGPLRPRTTSSSLRTQRPEAARIMCVPAGDGPDAGAVRVLVVPAAVDDELGRLRFEQLIPEEETLRQIGAALDERRVIGSRVVVEPPVYQGVTIVARLRAKPRTSTERLERDAIEALHRYFHPITGGPDGRGWQFGRPVLVGEVFSVLQSVSGLELVEDARLFAADPLVVTAAKRSSGSISRPTLWCSRTGIKSWSKATRGRARERAYR